MIIVAEEKLEAVKVTIQCGKDKTVRYLHGTDQYRVLDAINAMAQNGDSPEAPKVRRPRKAAAEQEAREQVQ